MSEREVSKGIVVDPDRHSGDPCIAGRRIPAGMVASYVQEGYDLDELCDDYNLTKKQIVQALAWDRKGRPS